MTRTGGGTTRRLRVGVDLLWLVPGVVGGTEDAAVGMLEALRANDDLDVTLYVQPTFLDAHPVLADAYRCRVLPIPGDSRALRVLAQVTWLAAMSRRDRLDVLHCYGGVVSPLAPRPSVLTLHDVQPLDHPDAFSAGKARWLATMIPRSVRAASVVLVPSQFVADRLVDRFGPEVGDVRVISHGVPRDRAASPGVAVVRDRYRLEGPFALYPAISYVHKNHATLLEAWAVMRDRGVAIPLVLTGGAGPLEEALQTRIERLGLGDLVRRVGRVGDEELEALYESAAVLVFPSSYEGFGLPVLEAMHAGCPVVAADVASIPEVAGGAAVLVDPFDVDGWADAVSRVIGDDGLAEELRDAGVRRAGMLEWDRLTPLMIDAYQSAARSTMRRGGRGRR